MLAALRRGASAGAQPAGRLLGAAAALGGGLLHGGSLGAPPRFSAAAATPEPPSEPEQHYIIASNTPGDHHALPPPAAASRRRRRLPPANRPALPTAHPCSHQAAVAAVQLDDGEAGCSAAARPRVAAAQAAPPHRHHLPLFERRGAARSRGCWAPVASWALGAAGCRRVPLGAARGALVCRACHGYAGEGGGAHRCRQAPLPRCAVLCSTGRHGRRCGSGASWKTWTRWRATWLSTTSEGRAPVLPWAPKVPAAARQVERLACVAADAARCCHCCRRRSELEGETTRPPLCVTASAETIELHSSRLDLFSDMKVGGREWSRARACLPP